MLEEVKREWLAQGRAGATDLEPCALTDGISWLYKKAQLAPPIVLVLDSPLAARMAMECIRWGIGGQPRRRRGWGEVYWTQVGYDMPEYAESEYRIPRWHRLSEAATEPILQRVEAALREQLGFPSTRGKVDWGALTRKLAQRHRRVHGHEGSLYVVQSSPLGEGETGYVGSTLSGGGWSDFASAVMHTVRRKAGHQRYDEVERQFASLERDWNRGAAMDSRGMIWATPPRATSDQIDEGRFANVGSHWDVCPAAAADLFERTGVEVGELARRWIRLLKVGFWDCLPTEYFAFVVRRPLTAQRDERGRLHREGGPAVTWLDGYANYYLQGLSLPEQVVMRPQELTPTQVLAEPNLEVRRMMTERLGWEPFLHLAVTLDRDADGSGQPRRLLRFKDLLGTAEPVALVGVTCPSTGRGYHLRVPPGVHSCAEAVAWTFGLDEPSYRPAVQT